jgi:hypothetical protein
MLSQMSLMVWADDLNRSFLQRRVHKISVGRILAGSHQIIRSGVS